MNAETAQLEARGKFLGAEWFGDIGPWANAVSLGDRPFLQYIVVLGTIVPRAMREATRPALAWATIIAAFALTFIHNEYAPAALDMAMSIYSLYFGDRMTGYIKGRIGGGVSK